MYVLVEKEQNEYLSTLLSGGLYKTIFLEIDKCKSKMRLRYQRYWLYSVGALKGIFKSLLAMSKVIKITLLIM